MLPEADPVTGFLPPGIHNATWQEVVARFGFNSHRRKLLGGLSVALSNLAGAGCQSILLNGSFVSHKTYPADYDGAWEIQGVDTSLVDAAFFDFRRGRAMMKSRFWGNCSQRTKRQRLASSTEISSRRIVTGIIKAS